MAPLVGDVDLPDDLPPWKGECDAVLERVADKLDPDSPEAALFIGQVLATASNVAYAQSCMADTVREKLAWRYLGEVAEDAADAYHEKIEEDAEEGEDEDEEANEDG